MGLRWKQNNTGWSNAWMPYRLNRPACHADVWRGDYWNAERERYATEAERGWHSRVYCATPAASRKRYFSAVTVLDAKYATPEEARRAADRAAAEFMRKAGKH